MFVMRRRRSAGLGTQLELLVRPGRGEGHHRPTSRAEEIVRFGPNRQLAVLTRWPRLRTLWFTSTELRTSTPSANAGAVAPSSNSIVALRQVLDTSASKIVSISIV